AFILLLIFTAVQTAPAVESLCYDIKVSIFSPDEEKGCEKLNVNNVEELKEKKSDFTAVAPPNTSVLIKIILGLRGNKDKLPLPVLEMISVPPNC
ncbi:MAG: hypothetical protein WD135_07880, partial [Ferruginibacter sp.]